jgi:hypothetical protein
MDLKEYRQLVRYLENVGFDGPNPNAVVIVEKSGDPRLATIVSGGGFGFPDEEEFVRREDIDASEVKVFLKVEWRK